MIETYQVRIFSKATDLQVREQIVEATNPAEALKIADKLILRSEYAGSAYRY